MMEETTPWTIAFARRVVKHSWIIRPLRFKFELLMRYHERDFLTRTREGFYSKYPMSVYYLPTIIFTCIQGPLAAQSRDDPDP